MRIDRIHTRPETDLFSGIRLRKAAGEERMEYAIPENWASVPEHMVEKIFHRGALPAVTRAIEEEGVPAWLRRREADTHALDGISAEARYFYENDFRDVLHRMAGGWTYRAWKAGLFDADEDARAFYDEIRYLLLHRFATPEIALWAASGLDWAYGLPEQALPVLQRIAAFDPAHPAKDVAGAGLALSLAAEGDAFARIRLAERMLALDGGRASVILPAEHVASLDFIRWKHTAEMDILARGVGRKLLDACLHNIMDACDRSSPRRGFDPALNEKLAGAVDAARARGISESAIRMAVSYAAQGHEEIPLPRFSLEDEVPDGLTAVLSVSDAFVESALTGHGVMLYEGASAQRHYSAALLWDFLAESVWSSGEPRVFFRDRAAAPASMHDIAQSRTGGFIFAPGHAAPSATLDAAKFMRAGGLADVAALSAATRLMLVALDTEAQGPARPVVVGLTNIAPALMAAGLAYDSDEGRAMAGFLCAFVSGTAHAASAEMAAKLGAFGGSAVSGKDFLRGVQTRAGSLSGSVLGRGDMSFRAGACRDEALVSATRAVWEEAYNLGCASGFRHAHLTAIDADEDMQGILGAQGPGIAPVPALARFEGWFEGAQGSGLYGKKMNPAAVQALRRLNYTPQEIDDIHSYVVGHGTLLDAPGINHAALKDKGFHAAALDALESALKSAQHIRYAFNKWTLGPDFCNRMLGFPQEEMDLPGFDMLTALGFSEDDIESANTWCCGAMTLEGAPHLKLRHLSVFDCVFPQGAGIRGISYDAQLRMQASVELFLSGAAVHTVSIAPDSGIETVQKLTLRAWELGLKELRVWRDSSSLLHAVAPATAYESGISGAEDLLPARLKTVS